MPDHPRSIAAHEPQKILHYAQLFPCIHPKQSLTYASQYRAKADVTPAKPGAGLGLSGTGTLACSPSRPPRANACTAGQARVTNSRAFLRPDKPADPTGALCSSRAGRYPAESVPPWQNPPVSRPRAPPPPKLTRLAPPILPARARLVALSSRSNASLARAPS